MASTTSAWAASPPAAPLWWPAPPGAPRPSSPPSSFDLPQAIALEWLARADTAVPPAPAERLQTWIDGGWVSARDGRVTSTVRLADGQLSVNGKPVPLLRSVFGR
jgi:hypothetical protein